MRFTIACAARYRRPHPGGDNRVKEVHVETHVQHAVALLHPVNDPPDQDSDTELIDMSHVDDGNTALPNQLAFALIDRADAKQIKMSGRDRGARLITQKPVEPGLSAPVAAYSNKKPIHIVHLDAHFDFINERNGITWGHGSPMRRASEMAHVKGITTLGPHNMASVSRKDWEAAKAYGTHVVPLRKLRAQGAAASLAHIPEGERVYVSIDIDSFDPSIAPGTATISHGGFTYYEGKEILREVAKRFEVVGADFVEVSPPYDPSGITALLAARTSLDFIGSIFHERAKRRA